jgi:hypothetical protein
LSIDISDKNIRNREKDFLPPAFSKNGPERAGSHPVELFSRTGRTCYGFQVLIRSKEEDDDDEMSGTPYTLPTFRQRTTVREFPFT